MIPLRLGFDMDGVLADFRSAFERIASARATSGSPTPEAASSEGLTTRQMKQVWARIQSTPNWWAGLEPYEPAQIARLYELARRFQWEVVFMTRRPVCAGDSVQFQTQHWLERHGFAFPAVVTVPGSRGELANALKLDLAVDDQLYNCVDIVTGSSARALLLLRDANQALATQASERGIGVATSLEETLNVIEGLHQARVERKGRLQRVSEWFQPRAAPLQAERPDPDRAPLTPAAPDDPGRS